MSSVNCKILRVNLSDNSITTEQPEETFFRTYFGGRALIAHYLLKETNASVTPLSPQNKIIIAAGPLTGTSLAGTGRNSIGCISPLTNAYGDAEVGGYWGAELKKAGFDAIIVEGKAKQPVYINISDCNVEVKDASDIWGLLTAESDRTIKQQLEDSSVKVCQIGPAGEKQIPFACVTQDLTHFAGRTGIGAVFGSKNLKAIVVKGTSKVDVLDPPKIKELASWMAKNYLSLTGALHDQGTANVLMPLNLAGGLPTKNFQESVFPDAIEINGESLRDKYLIKRESCFACPIRCKRVVQSEGRFNVQPIYGGPEYETIAAFGSLCCVSDLEIICKCNEVCNAYGLDTISTGVSIAFAMECYENGLITKEDAGGIELNFGNAENMLEMVYKIIKQEDIGYLLSKGVKQAAVEIGGAALDFAMHIKGQEIPLHEPRFKHGLGLGYAVSTTGADHCHNLHDTPFEKSVKSLEPFGILETVPSKTLNEQKVRMFTYFTIWRHFGNCALNCLFVPWSQSQMVDMVKAATGWNTSLWELMKVGERAVTLTKIINYNRGLRLNDDQLNKRFYQAFTSGPLSGVAVNRNEFMEALILYYEMMGWDKEGKPHTSKLHELNIGWAKEYIT